MVIVLHAVMRRPGGLVVVEETASQGDEVLGLKALEDKVLEDKVLEVKVVEIVIRTHKAAQQETRAAIRHRDDNR